MPRILLAEDDRLTRHTLGNFLRGEGLEVDLAENGAQAIELLGKKKFDLVISDVVMPQANGWRVLEHVSSTAPGTPVLLMTAYSALPPGETQAVELILKPLVLGDFLAKIEQLLEQKKTSEL